MAKCPETIMMARLQQKYQEYFELFSVLLEDLLIHHRQIRKEEREVMDRRVKKVRSLKNYAVEIEVCMNQMMKWNNSDKLYTKSTS
jgi:hypothetical protein